jgi:DNA-binding MarR family transcriptional regulator
MNHQHRILQGEVHELKRYTRGKLASVITQSSHCFLDRELAQYGIGWGQQHMLLRVKENEGANVLEFAKLSFLDQSTTTRAIQKLEQLGYVRTEVNPNDRRIRRVYTTAAALPVIDATIAAIRKWEQTLIRDMSDDEAENAQRLMEKMARNAFESLHGQRTFNGNSTSGEK